MANNKNNVRQYFTRCAQSYRFFLEKFAEKPVFDFHSIGVGLSYVYDKMYKRKGPVPWRSKVRLINTIMLNEQKILQDLDTLKRFPKCGVTPLIKTNVSHGRVAKLVAEILDDCEDYDRYDEEELLDNVCKKFRCCSNSENAKTIIKELKKTYVQQRKNNGQISQQQSPIRKRRILTRAKRQQMPNPIVLLEKNVNLGKLTNKNINDPEIKPEERKSSEESKIKKCNQDCIDNNVIEKMHVSSTEKEVEQNNTLQNLLHSGNLLWVKQEKDLSDADQATPEATEMENESSQTESERESTENHSNNVSFLTIENNSQSSQTVETISVQSTPPNDQENILGMRIENNINNVIPSMQLMNNARFIPNSVLMFNGNCNAYTVMPLPQFQPNIIMVNSNDLSNVYQGMFNNQMQFNNPLLQNPMLAAMNVPMMSEQQLRFNQGLNQSQDIARIQTMIENLNSQVNSLGNILANRIQRNE